jgi:hypothetical protein
MGEPGEAIAGVQAHRRFTEAEMNHSPNVAAVAVVIIVNWILAHVANDWVLPQEVQSAVQALITVWLGWWLAKRAEAKE